tara:strand:+ start:52 stop:789 length:738 start_codon:yes stop_codon:yes gene_type:complete
MKDICLVINTFSKYSDVWQMFFDSLDRHFPDVKRYVFVDKGSEPDKNSTTIHYNKEDLFRTQFIKCIEQVPEKYCIFISEDYVLYDDVRTDLVKRYRDVLEENKNLTFIKFVKGMDFGEPKYKNYDDLYEMSNVFPYFYSQSASLWKTRDLEKIFKHTPDSHIAGHDMSQQLEILANNTCQLLDIQGLFCYNGEEKVGIYHYDNIVFPHITTALVKGKWNLSEYRDKLMPLLKKYKIDPEIRGIY